MVDLTTTLSKAAKIKEADYEDRADFLKAVAEKLHKASEADWKKLPKDAQSWVNNAIEALDEGETVPEPAGSGGEDAEARAEADAEADAEAQEASEAMQEEKEMATKPKGKPSPKKPTSTSKAPTSDEKSKPAAKAKEPTAKPKVAMNGVNGSEAKVRIKRAILKKPSISVDELVAQLSKGAGEPISPHTVSNIRAEFRHSLRVLKADGYVKIEL